jgi:hypothetical protein
MLIAHLAAEATRLKLALTPLESDNLDDDLSPETDNVDENSQDGIRPQPVEKAAGIPQLSMATEAPKKKQPVKRKSAGKTAIEGIFCLMVSY